MIGTPVVAVRHARFRYPRAALDAVDIEHFAVARAEHVFVRGPSGSGKTTLLSLIAGVLTATAGQIELQGTEWTGLSSAMRDRVRADHVGYIFQQFNLLPYLSVLDNVVLPCRFSASRHAKAGESAEAVRGSATQLLRRMGLGRDFLGRSAAELSVGQQQRVAAARALIGQPELVIADEPTSALDEALRESFMRVLLEACRDAGSALVFVSHDARLASRFTRLVDLPAINSASS
ncbi:MAG: ABC transporter ATP-binding protein, partial [Pseudomonadota bacterium]|nr:ABC transporter ATP-binding protein [Pseudomonadota bacterium]